MEYVMNNTWLVLLTGTPCLISLIVFLIVFLKGE